MDDDTVLQSSSVTTVAPDKPKPIMDVYPGGGPMRITAETVRKPDMHTKIASAVLPHTVRVGQIGMPEVTEKAHPGPIMPVETSPIRPVSEVIKVTPINRTPTETQPIQPPFQEQILTSQPVQAEQVTPLETKQDPYELDEEAHSEAIYAESDADELPNSGKITSMEDALQKAATLGHQLRDASEMRKLALHDIGEERKRSILDALGDETRANLSSNEKSAAKYILGRMESLSGDNAVALVRFLKDLQEAHDLYKSGRGDQIPDTNSMAELLEDLRQGKFEGDNDQEFLEAFKESGLADQLRNKAAVSYVRDEILPYLPAIDMANGLERDVADENMVRDMEDLLNFHTLMRDLAGDQLGDYPADSLHNWDKQYALLEAYRYAIGAEEQYASGTLSKQEASDLLSEASAVIKEAQDDLMMSLNFEGKFGTPEAIKAQERKKWDIYWRTMKNLGTAGLMAEKLSTGGEEFDRTVSQALENKEVSAYIEKTIDKTIESGEENNFIDLRKGKLRVGLTVGAAILGASAVALTYKSPETMNMVLNKINNFNFSMVLEKINGYVMGGTGAAGAIYKKYKKRIDGYVAKKLKKSELATKINQTAEGIKAEWLSDKAFSFKNTVEVDKVIQHIVFSKMDDKYKDIDIEVVDSLLSKIVKPILSKHKLLRLGNDDRLDAWMAVSNSIKKSRRTANELIVSDELIDEIKQALDEQYVFTVADKKKDKK